MLVSDSHKFILFHYPKTGGSSMTEVLARYLTPTVKVPEVKFGGWQPKHHYDFLQHRPIKECPYGEFSYTYFLAAFVRNPYSLVVSAWDRKTSFQDFIDKKVITKEAISTRWTQSEYLCDDQGILLVDFVGRYEQLDLDWQKFCYMTKLPKLKLSNLNNTDKGDYRQYYNEATYQIVNKLYKKDFNLFKYSEKL